MKTYSVHPGSTFIRVSDGRSLTGEGGDIAWGDTGPGALFLCRAILLDVLGDRGRAEKLAQRFKWRTVKDWPKDSARAITENEVKTIVADIEYVANEHADMIARQQRERPQFVTDRADPGQHWSRNPDIKPKEIPHGGEGKTSGTGNTGTG